MKHFSIIGLKHLTLMFVMFLLPSTGSTADFEVVNSFPTPNNASAIGLAWDGNNLWMSGSVTDPDTSEQVRRLLRVNPLNGELISYIDYSVEDTQGPQGLTFDSDGYIRVASWSTNAIYKISTTGELISYFRPPQNPRGVAWDGYSLWSFSSSTAAGVFELGELYHHSADGYLIDTFYVDIEKRHSRDLAFDGANFWLAIQSYTQNMYRIDQSGNILDTYDLSDQGVPGMPYGVVWIDDHLWVAIYSSPNWKIYQLKPTTYVPPPIGDLDFDGDVDGDDLSIFTDNFGTNVNP